MLNYYTLSEKPKITIDGESTIDLLHKTIKLDNELSGQFIEVNEYYIARPDLISLAIYGDDRYADIICKVNGISNPFELNEGQIIFLPTYETINTIVDVNSKESKTEVIDNYKDMSISNSYKIGAQKRKDEERSPAQQLIGDQNYIIDKSLGVVFY